jgi:hypothetical protein
MDSLRRSEDDEAGIKQLKSLSVELVAFFESQPAATAPLQSSAALESAPTRPDDIASRAAEREGNKPQETDNPPQESQVSQQSICAEKAIGDDETKTKDDRKESTEGEEESCSSDGDSASWDDDDSFAWDGEREKRWAKKPHLRRLIEKIPIPLEALEEPNFNADKYHARLHGKDIRIVRSEGVPPGWILIHLDEDLF